MKLFKQKPTQLITNKIIDSLNTTNLIKKDSIRSRYIVYTSLNHAPSKSVRKNIKKIIHRSDEFSLEELIKIDQVMLAHNAQKRVMSKYYNLLKINSLKNLITSTPNNFKVKVSLTNYPNPVNLVDMIIHFNGDPDTIQLLHSNFDKYAYSFIRSDEFKIEVKNATLKQLATGNGILLGEFCKISNSIDYYAGCTYMRSEQAFVNKHNDFMQKFQLKYFDILQSQIERDNLNKKILILNDTAIHFPILTTKLVFKPVWKDLIRPQVFIKKL